MREEEWWDILGQERMFGSAKKRHDLIGKIDALRFTEEVEDLDAEGFKQALRESYIKPALCYSCSRKRFIPILTKFSGCCQ